MTWASDVITGEDAEFSNQAHDFSMEQRRHLQ